MATTLGKMLTGDGNITWTIIDDGQVVVKSASKSHNSYSKLYKAYKEDDVEEFLKHIDVVESINEFLHEADEEFATLKLERVVFDEQRETFTYGGVPLHNALTDRILHLKREGMPFKSMLLFLNNLLSNPSRRSVEQLYPFLEHGNMPITEDGCFLAYKTVMKHSGEPFTDVNGREVKDGDLVDKYSRSVRNNVGDVVEMPRNMVDDNPESHCSHGYHVGSLQYSGPGGSYNSAWDTVIIVKVNPKDAVSVPSDHSCQKLRTCAYEVVSIFSEPLAHSLYTADGSEYDYDDDDDDDFSPDFDEDFSEIEVKDLRYGDEVRFDYTNSEGETYSHHGFVETIMPTTFRLRLGDDDVDFNDRDYSTFVKERVANLRLAD